MPVYLIYLEAQRNPKSYAWGGNESQWRSQKYKERENNKIRKKKKAIRGRRERRNPQNRQW